MAKRKSQERLVFCCRTTSASTAPCTSRKVCCPTHGASYFRKLPARPPTSSIRSVPSTTCSAFRYRVECVGSGVLSFGCRVHPPPLSCARARSLSLSAFLSVCLSLSLSLSLFLSLSRARALSLPPSLNRTAPSHAPADRWGSILTAPATRCTPGHTRAVRTPTSPRVGSFGFLSPSLARSLSLALALALAISL